MINCPVCKEPITSSSISYKASAGFLDEDGVFHEDVKIIIHVGCHQQYYIYKRVKRKDANANYKSRCASNLEIEVLGVFENGTR